MEHMPFLARTDTSVRWALPLCIYLLLPACVYKYKKHDVKFEKTSGHYNIF